MVTGRTSPHAPCPCGSGERYDGCCGPLHAGRPAATALALMRSRYSAFALGYAHHLSATWHPGTVPGDVGVDAATRWTGLEIIATDGGEPGDRRGVVEFAAHYREGGSDGVLRERSRFVFQSGRWWYLDGRG
ncbi:YchJ family metal-binding protein [Microbacterium sp. LRZ72]|uniref:YchJ family protein n=1 Tax=Microbacterium sp. LRZ72 TaxID=2942481 RepID=UPI0029B6285B|nr:YchJ family metal-binding protein [Microbacterium sp. LRZ72]MDX2375227.1 YchJ family metal-binding protein [Microbacterium sp. LRZ72]